MNPLSWPWTPRTTKCAAWGAEAKAVIGRTPGSIVAVRPLKDGVIADFDITANMLENFLKKACGNSMFSRPRVVICIPSGVTEVERRAVREATLKAGARQVSVIEEPMAAAIGAGLPISEPTGSMIVDIGGGTAEIAVICSGWHRGFPQRPHGRRYVRPGHHRLHQAQV